jgi:hypothetical protein
MDVNPVNRWWKAHEAEKYFPETFLKQREAFCVTACARFRDLNFVDDHAWVFSVGNLGDARAMILHSKRTVFPVFCENTQLNIPVFLVRALKNIDIHAIHGLAIDVEAL